MAQVERDENLDRFESPALRLVTVILIRCGLRVSDALRLPRECVVTDAEGAPYLRYLNHKMRREALVPIDEQLQALIAAQQQCVGQAPCLFPRPTKNPDQAQPLASGTYRAALYQWLRRCDVRDEHGRPVRFTPHQWQIISAAEARDQTRLVEMNQQVLTNLDRIITSLGDEQPTAAGQVADAS